MGCFTPGQMRSQNCLLNCRDVWLSSDFRLIISSWHHVSISGNRPLVKWLKDLKDPSFSWSLDCVSLILDTDWGWTEVQIANVSILRRALTKDGQVWTDEAYVFYILRQTHHFFICQGQGERMRLIFKSDGGEIGRNLGPAVRLPPAYSNSS